MPHGQAEEGPFREEPAVSVSDPRRRLLGHRKKETTSSDSGTVPEDSGAWAPAEGQYDPGQAPQPTQKSIAEHLQGQFPQEMGAR